MNSKYLSMFKQIEEDHLQFTEKILFVDGTNTFIRSVCVNLSVDDNGEHVGGLVGFLLSIGYAIKVIRPTRIIIVFDGSGGSKRRKELYPEYKKNRVDRARLTTLDIFKDFKEEQMSMLKQSKRLIQYLECLPLQFVLADDIEADDAIAYFCKEKFSAKSIKKFIMSTDKDFLQLVDPETTVWSPTKKVFYSNDNFFDLVGVYPQNYILIKTFTGDSSDNIPGIKGCGLKTLIKRFPILLENKDIHLQEIIDLAKKGFEEKKIKIYEEIVKNSNRLKLNYVLMQLKDVQISDYTKILLSNSVDRKNPILNSSSFLKMLLEDRIEHNIKNPDVWLRDVWFSLHLSSKTV